MISFDLQSEQELAEITNALKALSGPNRLRIFGALMTGDSCNCELKDKLDMPPNLLSHHLRVLSEAGLVTSRRDSLDGRWIYYLVDRRAASRWQAWLTAFLDPARIQERPVCGPEGQISLDDIELFIEPAD
jgi:ArsR family transcriptional regulator